MYKEKHMMKKSILILILLATIMSSCGAKNNKTAEQTLSEFYTQYITECINDYNSDAIGDIMEEFVTKELRQRLDTLKLDYNPFLHAQEYDKAYLETLEIKPISGQENVYCVCYKFYSSEDPKNCIILFMIEIDGKYFINNIEGLSTSASENLYTSDIRPDELLALETIFTDQFEYIDCTEGEYRDLFILKKDNKEITLFDNTKEPEDYSTIATWQPGDKVEVLWKLERFYHEGGGEFYIGEFVEKITKID